MRRLDLALLLCRAAAAAAYQINARRAAATRPLRASPGEGAAPARVDVILSSGFLCFSRHAGFLDAFERSGMDASAYVGTSSGALAASMAAAGLGADAVAKELSKTRPLRACRPSVTPWRGPFSTRGLRKRGADVLPKDFDDLAAPLGLGVYDRATLETRLVTSGDLRQAVAASCAVPGLFSPVRLGGDALYLDGGKIDRTFYEPWQKWRPGRPAVVHLVKDEGVELVERDGIPLDADATIVKTPRAKAKLWSLGDFNGEREEAARLAGGQLYFKSLGW
mmetsp:Transcript_13689/g.40769  ORF Transcript_13689/g.40769 Transcript_13689/m.40769 type:complete len:279 (-) Transcript_13689:3-839(-)